MAFNKLVYFETKSLFNNQLENLNDLSIAFIKDTGELWTHGRLFGGYFSNVDNNKVKLVIGNVEKLLSLDGHTQSYTTLTGSGTTANQAIVSTGTANKWILKTLGKNAFSNEDFLPADGTAVAATNIAGGVKGSIPYQTASSKTAMLAPPTVNGYVLKFNTTTGIPYWAADNNTTYTTKVLKVNNTSYNVYTSSSSLPTLWAPSSLGTANLVLKVNSTGDGLTWGTDNNSDTKVLQSETTTANYRPILFGYNNSSSVEDLTNSVTLQAYTTSNIYVQPSTGSLWATKLYSGGKLVVTDVSNYVTLNTTLTITGLKTFTSQINSSLNTATYLEGNRGKAIINSTAGAGQYVMLFKGNSTNGYFTHGVYLGKYLLQYTVKSTVNAGTNAVTKSVTLLDESGNSLFPGNVTAPKFIGSLLGNADSATKLTTSAGSATRPIYFSDGKPVAGTYTFGNASGNAAINNGTVNSNLNADLLDGLHSSSFLRLQTISRTTDVNTLKDTRLYYTTSDAASLELVNPPFTNTFSMILVANLINGDTDWRRSIIAFNPYGDMKIFNDRGTSGDGGVWYTVLTSGNYSSILDTRYPTKTGGGASGTWGISISGNAATASKWATARTITLGSYLSGSVSLDGSTNVTLNANVIGLTTQGRKTAISGTTIPSSGVRLYEVYNNGYPTTYGNLLSIRGGGSAELLLAWKNTQRIYVRSKSDVSTEEWTAWKTVAFTDDNVASATTVKVTQHTTNNTNYPIVWSNEPNTNTNNSDLFKSWQHLHYNPSTLRLTATGGFIKGGSSDSYVLLGGGGHKALSDLGSSHTHSYLPLSGGTMNGGAQIKRAGISKSWITGREGALIRQTSIDGYSPLISMKTSEGSWDIGVFDRNRLHFSYITDSNYSSGTNKQTANIYLGSSGVIYSNGFLKSGSSSAYVLLGDGGHKALSDLQSEYDSRYVNITGDTMTGTLTTRGRVYAQLSNRTDVVGLFQSSTSNKGGLVLKDTSGTEHVLYLSTSNLEWKGRKVWDSGNDGSGSGLDSDLLDGRDSTEFFRSSVLSKQDLDANNLNSTYTQYTPSGDMNQWTDTKFLNFPTSKPAGGFSLLVLREGSYNRLIYGCYNDDHLYVRSLTYNNGKVWRSWNKLAFVTDNVSSATNADKLDGIHASGLLTALSSSSGTNLSITVGGTTKTIADLYATLAVNADKLDNLHASSFMRCDGTNSISLTGGNGNTAGWRLVLEKECGGWTILNIVISIASRHTGLGILSIGFHTTNDSGTNYSSSINFKGSTASLNSAPWRAFYNTSTKKFRLFWNYTDYNNTYINVLSRSGFNVPTNGTWYETLPSDNGTELTILYNNASKLGTSTVGGATTPIYLNGGSPTACSASTSGTASTIAVRDSNGDLLCRLVRPTHANLTTISGALAYRVNNSSDNYIRFCSDTAAIRTWLGVPSSSQLNKYLPLTGGTMTGTITSTNIDPIIIQNNTGPWIIKHLRSDGYEKGLYTADGYGLGLVVNGTLTNGVYINKSGNVGIGTTAPSTKLEVNGTVKVDMLTSTHSSGSYIKSFKSSVLNCTISGFGGIFSANTKNGRISVCTYPGADNRIYFGYATQSSINAGTPNSFAHLMYWDGSSGSLSIVGTALASEGFFELSDIRLKKNIKPITSKNEIELVEFNWKENEKKSYGVIAQLIEEYYPELVLTDKDTGYKSVNYDAVLIVKIALLENKIKLLEEKLKV